MQRRYEPDKGVTERVDWDSEPGRSGELELIVKGALRRDWDVEPGSGVVGRYG